MEIESVKTWHWVLAGLVLGALFSCVLYSTGPAFDTQARDTIEQGEFENDVMALTRFGQIPWNLTRDIQQFHKGQPMVRDITVHPPLASDPHHRDWVTGRVFAIGMRPVDPAKPAGPQNRIGEWKPFRYPANIPYEPGYTVREEKKLDKVNTPYQKARNAELLELKTALGGASSFPTVVDYLKAVAAMPNSDLSFKLAWWERTPFLWSLPPLAGLLVVGIAWPLTLSGLQSVGLAKPIKTKALPKPAEVKKPARPAMPPPVVIATAPPPPPVEADHKEYGGVYYPVVKTSHKDEVHAADKPK